MAKINTRIVRRSVGLLDASILHHSDRGATIDPSCQLYAPDFAYSEAALAPDEPTAVKMAVCTYASSEGGPCSRALTAHSRGFSYLCIASPCVLSALSVRLPRSSRSCGQRAAGAPACKLREMVEAGRLPKPGQGPDEENRRVSPMLLLLCSPLL